MLTELNSSSGCASSSRNLGRRKSGSPKIAGIAPWYMSAVLNGRQDPGPDISRRDRHGARDTVSGEGERVTTAKWSIPTEYNGTRFRSVLEAHMPRRSTCSALAWCYEGRAMLAGGRRWIPDFWLRPLAPVV